MIGLGTRLGESYANPVVIGIVVVVVIVAVALVLGRKKPAGPGEATTDAGNDALQTRAQPRAEVGAPQDPRATRARPAAAPEEDPFATRARGQAPAAHPDDVFATRARGAAPVPEADDPFATRARTETFPDDEDAFATRARGSSSPAGGDVFATRGPANDAADDAFATRGQANASPDQDAFATRARQAPPTDEDAFATGARPVNPADDDPFATRARGIGNAEAGDDTFATRARNPVVSSDENAFATRAGERRPEAPAALEEAALSTRARPAEEVTADDPFATRSRAVEGATAADDPFATRARGAEGAGEELAFPEEDDAFATRARGIVPPADDPFPTRARERADDAAPSREPDEGLVTRARGPHAEVPAAPPPAEMNTEMLRPATPPPPVVKPATLRCIEGPYNGQTFHVTDGGTLGRQADNYICLERDSAVSRRHAEILHQGESYRLRDVGSANGSFVNDEAVTDVILNVGDQIRIGRSLFKFEL